MALIQWTPELSVKIDAMDEQHKKLIKLINDLNDAMKHGRGKDVMEKVLGELISYTVTHFTAEEKFLTMNGYPKLAEQKLEHKKLIEKVSELQTKFKSGNAAISIEVMNFLTSWLTNHIQKSDKAYGEYINAKTAKAAPSRV